MRRLSGYRAPCRGAEFEDLFLHFSTLINNINHFKVSNYTGVFKFMPLAKSIELVV